MGGGISVSAGNACGVSSLRSKTVTRNNPLTPGVISGLSSGQCGVAQSIYSIASVPGANEYSWTVDGGSASPPSNSTSIAIDWSNTLGNGSVEVKSKNGCGISNGRVMTVLGKPSTPLIIFGPTAVCINTAYHYVTPTVLNATNYIWSSTGGIVVSGSGTKEVDILFQSTPATLRTVSVSASNSCGTSATRVLSGITVSSCLRNASTGIHDMVIYPNPSGGRALLSFWSEGDANGNLIIRDVAGKLISEREESVVSGLNEWNIDMENVSPGIYFIYIDSGSETKV